MTSPLLPLPVALAPDEAMALLRARGGELLHRFSARVLAVSVMAVLACGTLLSIATTTKHDWWQHHFSELGTSGDFSAHMFNTTLIVAGLLIAAFAVRVRLDLLTMTPLRQVRPARMLTVCMVAVGLNMSGVGLVPLNTIPFLHDRLASGIMLSFLGLLVVVVLRHRHGTALLLRATLGIAAGLATAIAVFLAGILNLAALEILGFTLIFVWVGVFTICLERGLTHAREHASRTAQAAAAPMTMCLSPRADTSPIGHSTITGCVPAHPSPSSSASRIRSRNVNHPAMRSGSSTTRDAAIRRPGSGTSPMTRTTSSARAVSGAPNSRNVTRAVSPSVTPSRTIRATTREIDPFTAIDPKMRPVELSLV